MYFQVIINSFSGSGPFCILFKDNEPCTVFDLKQKLAKTITVRVEEQKIRSLGGKLLTDSVDLLKSYGVQRGGPPIILNLTVRLVGGKIHNQQQLEQPPPHNEECLSSPDELYEIHETVTKKLRVDSSNNKMPLQRQDTMTDLAPTMMVAAKGKQKVTKKRKAMHE